MGKLLVRWSRDEKYYLWFFIKKKTF